MIKNVMKKILLCLTVLILPAWANAAADVDKKDPYQMIKTVADITFKRFANEPKCYTC